MGNYTNPDAAGCLLEAAACAQVIRELDRVTEKFKRKIEREAEKRREELRAALEYESLAEIHDAYGYDMITEQQYQLYTELFERGEAVLEDHAPTRAERVHYILLSIRRELTVEQNGWEFSALSPEEQAKELARRDKARREWKDYIKEVRARLHPDTQKGDN
ncbi:MAG: adenylosuccinate lyase [Dysosmobacter sp.]|nr:adenylosuccinate lyase [Dysosmobacter sp.]